jgi:hypothetical protein
MKQNKIKDLTSFTRLVGHEIGARKDEIKIKREELDSHTAETAETVAEEER